MYIMYILICNMWLYIIDVIWCNQAGLDTWIYLDTPMKPDTVNQTRAMSRMISPKSDEFRFHQLLPNLNLHYVTMLNFAWV